MLRRALVMIVTAVALWSAAGPACAVTLPWAETGSSPRASDSLTLDMESLSQALSAAGRSGFEGLRAARPAPGQSILAGIVRAVLRQAPWLGGSEGAARGLWTWSRHPARGIALYGPGAGGYSSFSWTRAPAVETAALPGMARLNPAFLAGQRPLPPGAAGSGPAGGGPTPVPLPPAAPLLLLALGATALLRRRRRTRRG